MKIIFKYISVSTISLLSIVAGFLGLRSLNNPSAISEKGDTSPISKAYADTVDASTGEPWPSAGCGCCGGGASSD